MENGPASAVPASMTTEGCIETGGGGDGALLAVDLQDAAVPPIPTPRATIGVPHANPADHGRGRITGES